MRTRFLAGALLFGAIHQLIAEQPCSSLSALTLPHTRITSALDAPEGPVPSAGGGNGPTITAPARCEVQAITRPSKDSGIRLLVWLPVSGWNGRYLQVGNGGWAGQINQGAMVGPLRRGYAVAATDDGH